MSTRQAWWAGLGLLAFIASILLSLYLWLGQAFTLPLGLISVNLMLAAIYCHSVAVSGE